MSDDWGDASGIEGNYEDDEEESNEMNETAETNSLNGTNETRKTKTNIKEEWNGRTIYVPDEILDELEDTYLESQLKLRKAGQDEFKKNRHFYPLVVQFGLEALSDADDDEIQTRLAEISDE
ncbi:hypothetical protein [Halococcus thailandensis]|uniref:DUF8160 domain-containing protein n=1 Tax=Halococcus thailandensis JCM 13552 TaxID=1227457 RepID=M0NDG3_9EURY|nr:hypothetical protein [Halococcus thailandensis]EMA55997.1 hypothetical protein C451_04586 [Halococcus thailandensis JCM 13552]